MTTSSAIHRAGVAGRTDATIPGSARVSADTTGATGTGHTGPIDERRPTRTTITARTTGPTDATGSTATTVSARLTGINTISARHTHTTGAAGATESARTTGAAATQQQASGTTVTAIATAAAVTAVGARITRINPIDAHHARDTSTAGTADTT